MFRNLLLLLCCFFTLFAQAQVEVIIRVDMSSETVSDQGLSLVGSFQDWKLKDAIPLESDGTDIYSVAVLLPPGEFEYAFINGQSETDRECQDDLSCLEACFTSDQNGQKARMLTVEENVIRQTLAAYKFNSCEETAPASIEELRNERNLIISPNPFSGSTTLVFANPKNQAFDILLHDVSGQLIRAYTELRGQDFEINRADLSSGMYLLTLRTDKGEVANRKLMVH